MPPLILCHHPLNFPLENLSWLVSIHLLWFFNSCLSLLTLWRQSLFLSCALLYSLRKWVLFFFFFFEGMNEWSSITFTSSILYKISRLHTNWLFLKTDFACIFQLSYFHWHLYNNNNSVDQLIISLYPYISFDFPGSLCFIYLNST